MKNRIRRQIYQKEISACSIFGAMNRSGERFGGKGVIRAMANMHRRGNGLGAGFAIYGLYPAYKKYYALHIMFEGRSEYAKKEADVYLSNHFDIVYEEEIPNSRECKVEDAPLIWRYFVAPIEKKVTASDDDYVVEKSMWINQRIKGAYVFSSGKDMGVFKGVGYPEDIAEYFLLDELYRGNLWTAHSRFPTNTPGWWGGAHPFGMLDWTVVHNGEISSYGTNRRYLEMHGYHCALNTDTEVVAYAIDLLMRRQAIPLNIAANIFSPPTWESIERRDEKERQMLTKLRMVYAPLLLNGPFAIIIAHHGEMIGLTDRIRLRPLTAATNGDMYYLSSEEAAIRLISPELDQVWTPDGGEPVVGTLNYQRELNNEITGLARVPG